MYSRSNVLESNNYRIFDAHKNLWQYDWYSIALNVEETRLLLVGHHEIAFINFEAALLQDENAIGCNRNMSRLSLSDVKIASLFDSNNVNRPIVEWNHSDTNQFAVAIDRIVRVYTTEHAQILETNAIIDSQHRRPISAISYAPHNPNLLLTGSLDGQIQVWDTRNCSTKCPASLKFTASTPFIIRHMQWSATKQESSNELAIQCDRCVRVYDIRRGDSALLSSTDIEHTQRITCMDWTQQDHSIVTLSIDNSIKIYSKTGQLLAESAPPTSSSETQSCTYTKIHTTEFDNLLVSASRTRDSTATKFGFVGWRWDGDQYIQPLTNHILSTTPSSVIDFCPITNPEVISLFNNSITSHANDESTNRFLLLALCRDEHLCFVDMDLTFQQAWMHQRTRNRLMNAFDASASINIFRTTAYLSRPQPACRNSSSILPMDVSTSEDMYNQETIGDGYENAFKGIPTTPPNVAEFSDADENDDEECSIPLDRKHNALTEVSFENEVECIFDTYGIYINVEAKDVQRHMCILRCIHPIDHGLSFRIYLAFSRSYPIISQMFIRFKLSIVHIDERLRSFLFHIKTVLEETSYNCFYQGKLCLHKCLYKLQCLFDKLCKQENSCLLTSNASARKREQFTPPFDIDTTNRLTNAGAHNTTANTDHNSNRTLMTSISSTRTIDSQLSTTLFDHHHRRTCGARFSGSSHLVCFGRIKHNHQSNSATLVSSPADVANRPQSLPIRSASVAVTKTRENSSTDEQSSYRGPMTHTVQIKHQSNNQRIPIFSAPVRPTFASNAFTDHPRLSATGYRRSLGRLNYPSSNVSIYDVSILLPISKKLADDYTIDLKNPIEMCEFNQNAVQSMGKSELAHMWRLFAGLLSLQTTLQPDDAWFQTPIAQGLIKRVVSNYVANGDIQSASMLVLAMSQSPYLKSRIHAKLVSEHNFDPILYAYASLLHRWKHFYRRTQILSQIDHNCQSPAPFNQTTIKNITSCSICLEPVLGQHFFCASCSHGGHLKHMYKWFLSDGIKHRYCPERDCTCRCIIKQQELLVLNTAQLQQQQQTSSVAARQYLTRQSSATIRPS